MIPFDPDFLLLPFFDSPCMNHGAKVKQALPKCAKTLTSWLNHRFRICQPRKGRLVVAQPLSLGADCRSSPRAE
jgi:hypothetical protein